MTCAYSGYADQANYAMSSGLRSGTGSAPGIPGDSIVGIVPAQLATQRRVLLGQAPVPFAAAPLAKAPCRPDTAYGASSSRMRAESESRAFERSGGGSVRVRP